MQWKSSLSGCVYIRFRISTIAMLSRAHVISRSCMTSVMIVRQREIECTRTRSRCCQVKRNQRLSNGPISCSFRLWGIVVFARTYDFCWHALVRESIRERQGRRDTMGESTKKLLSKSVLFYIWPSFVFTEVGLSGWFVGLLSAGSCVIQIYSMGTQYVIIIHLKQIQFLYIIAYIHCEYVLAHSASFVYIK